MSKIIENITSKQLKTAPNFSSGDTVVVSVKVKEGKRERIQAFEGVVVAIKNRGISSSFTVRKISYGEGVERVFQTHSPIIDSIKIKRKGLQIFKLNLHLEELFNAVYDIDIINEDYTQTSNEEELDLRGNAFTDNSQHIPYNFFIPMRK